MKLLNHYKNGNAEIILFDDGTRIINYPDGEELNVEFPLSMDMKITNYCDIGCPMCHEMSSDDGVHGDIMNLEFINYLHAGTEIAIGGGKVTSHPDLVPFLEKLKSLGVRPSITINQVEYKKNRELIDKLIDEQLIYGLGISFVYKDDDFWEKFTNLENVVVHLIAGIHTKDDFDYLKRFKAKVLILGFKDWGRGHELWNSDKLIPIKNRIEWLATNLKEYVYSLKLVSFDNLAIKQLGVKSIMSEEEWNEFYQGDDGTHTMYVDAVKQEFAKTSTSPKRYTLGTRIEDMFKTIKGEI